MLLHVAGLTPPLFLLMLLGAVLSRLGWPRTVSDALTRFVFTEFGIRAEWRPSFAITALKLVGQPAAVYGVARFLALPRLETTVSSCSQRSRSARMST